MFLSRTITPIPKKPNNSQVKCVYNNRQIDTTQLHNKITAANIVIKSCEHRNKSCDTHNSPDAGAVAETPSPLVVYIEVFNAVVFWCIGERGEFGAVDYGEDESDY